MTILDSLGRKRAQMPKWHEDVDPRPLVTWCGHWFRFEGIDPAKPETVFFTYVGPTKSTKRRNDAQGKGPGKP